MTCQITTVYGNVSLLVFFFFFQAEDGIRDYKVTGVQTCALPIFEAVIAGIEGAGFEPGKDVAIALDPAASELYQDGMYVFKKSGAGSKSAEDMIALYKSWIDRYPIVSIEDGLAEDDWTGWAKLTEALSARVQLVGDDLFCTNLERLDRGIEEGVANAILIKLNQIRTLTETLQCIEHARSNGYGALISHRSGQTEDTFIAHLAVGVVVGQSQ